MTATTAAGCVRVLLVDDEAGVLAALARVLTPARGTLVVGALSSAGALVGTVARLKPDMVLLDLDMPGRPALDAVGELHAKRHGPKVAVLSGLMDEAQIRGLLAAGVTGYILKDDAPAALLEALPLLAAGRRYISPTVAEFCPDLGADDRVA